MIALSSTKQIWTTKLTKFCKEVAVALRQSITFACDRSQDRIFLLSKMFHTHSLMDSLLFRSSEVRILLKNAIFPAVISSYGTSIFLFSFMSYVQLSISDYKRLLHKPYVNEVYFTGQNPPLKFCQHLEIQYTRRKRVDL